VNDYIDRHRLAVAMKSEIVSRIRNLPDILLDVEGMELDFVGNYANFVLEFVDNPSSPSELAGIRWDFDRIPSSDKKPVDPLLIAVDREHSVRRLRLVVSDKSSTLVVAVAVEYFSFSSNRSAVQALRRVPLLPAALATSPSYLAMLLRIGNFVMAQTKSRNDAF
jgi:hypothetical protein